MSIRSLQLAVPLKQESRIRVSMQCQDVRQMSGCEIEVRDLPSHDEAIWSKQSLLRLKDGMLQGLCTLLGNIESRVKAAVTPFSPKRRELRQVASQAAQQFLKRLEEAGLLGTRRHTPPAFRTVVESWVDGLMSSFRALFVT